MFAHLASWTWLFECFHLMWFRRTASTNYIFSSLFQAALWLGFKPGQEALCRPVILTQPAGSNCGHFLLTNTNAQKHPHIHRPRGGGGVGGGLSWTSTWPSTVPRDERSGGGGPAAARASTKPLAQQLSPPTPHPIRTQQGIFSA